MAELLSDLCFALCVRYLLATQVSAFDRWMMRHESLVLQDECTEKGELLFQRRECRGVLWQWRGRYQRIREDEGRFLRAHGHWVKRLKTGSCCVWRKLTRDGKQFKQRLKCSAGPDALLCELTCKSRVTLAERKIQALESFKFHNMEVSAHS